MLPLIPILLKFGALTKDYITTKAFEIKVTANRYYKPED